MTVVFNVFIHFTTNLIKLVVEEGAAAEVKPHEELKAASKSCRKTGRREYKVDAKTLTDVGL